MATPSSTRPYSTSTPKNNPAATPTHLTSSPHPSTSAAMARPLSHKSPSIKTPASGHGHAHHPSVSSHPSSTPLAATTSLDDHVAFSSPSAAALMALSGMTGITPSPAVHDGLVGPAMTSGDLRAMGIPGLGIRDTEEERLRRIEKVVRMLRTRVAGRGICREGIERLSRLTGYDYLPSGNTLSLAGKQVSIDVVFDAAEADKVTDVILDFPISTVEQATAVLKRDLIMSQSDREMGYWKDAEGFKDNLERLRQLDRLSEEVNCFEAVEGLYESLRRVWRGEKERFKGQGHLQRLCKGSVGRPIIHKGRKLGLGLEYWVEKRRILEAQEGRAEKDAMEVDEQHEQGGEDEEAKIWTAFIECDIGYPPIRVSKDWVSNEVFKSSGAQESASFPADESQGTAIDWLEPPETLITPSALNANSDAMALDSNFLGVPKNPDVCFVAKFQPPVVVPMSVASLIYEQVGILMPQNSIHINTYDGLLFASESLSTSVKAETPGAVVEDPSAPKQIHQSKAIIVFDDEGHPVEKKQTYSLYLQKQELGRVLTEIPFSHPRQLTSALSVLRQYALLTSLLHNTFSTSTSKDNTGVTATSAKSPSTDVPKGKQSNAKTRSNTDPLLSTLNSQLSINGVSAHLPAGDADNEEDEKSVAIDIDLNTSNPTSPRLNIIIALDEALGTASVSVELGPNGEIRVLDFQGVPFDDREKQMVMMTKALSISEDFGALVEWIRKRLRKQDV